MTPGEGPEGLDDLEDGTFFDAPAEFEGESADDSPLGGRVPEECEDFVEREGPSGVWALAGAQRFAFLEGTAIHIFDGALMD